MRRALLLLAAFVALTAATYVPQPVSSITSTYNGALLRGILINIDTYLRQLSAAGVGGSTGFEAVGAPFIVTANNAGLSSERKLLGTSNQITLTDGGANSTLTLSAPQNLHTTASFKVHSLRSWSTSNDSIPLRVRAAGSPSVDIAQIGAQNGTDYYFRVGSDGQSYFGSTTTSGIVNIPASVGSTVLKVGSTGTTGVLTLKPSQSSRFEFDVAGVTTSRFTTATKWSFQNSTALLGSTSGELTFAAPSTITDYTVTWPNAQATAANQFLKNDGSGGLAWSTLSSTIGKAFTANNETNIGLTLNGGPTVALLDTVRIVPTWSGQLSLARGGTAANLTASNGAIVYSTAAAHAHSSVGTSNDVFRSGGAGAPTWSTPRAFTTNNETNITLTANGTPSTALLDSIRIVPGWSGTLAVSRGGTGQATATAAFDALDPLTTRGDILVHNGTNSARTALGPVGSPLVTTGTDVVWDQEPEWRGDHFWVDSRPIIKGYLEGAPQAIQWWNADSATSANGTLDLQASPPSSGAITVEIPNAPGQVTITGSGAIPVSATARIGKVNTTAKTDTIPVTNITNITGSSIATGFYLVNAYLACTTAEAGAGQLNFHLTWTDDAGLQNAVPILPAPMTVVRSYSSQKIVYVSSGNISYGVRGYTNPAGGATPAYAVRVRVTFLGT